MNILAVSKGDLLIYWNSIVIVLGALSGLALSLALCHDKKCSKAAVLAFFPFAFVFSLLIARIMNWYFFAEQYPSFVAAISDFTVGGFCVTGILFGSMLAGLIVKLMHLASFRNLMDTVAAGIALTISFIRLSALFGSTCHSKIIVTSPVFQRLPFAIASVDAAGNTVYRFATFFVAFILFALVALLTVGLFAKHRDDRLVKGAGNTGNVANIALVMCCAVEMVMDSTRGDSTALHFMLLSSINKYVNFVSVSMIIGAVCILVIFIHYLKYSHRAYGKKAHVLWLVLGFIICVAGVGGTEYCGQRFTGLHTLWHSSQAAFAALMVFIVYRAYKHCLADRD